jgi:hypothetical protein
MGWGCLIIAIVCLFLIRAALGFGLILEAAELAKQTPPPPGDAP